MVRVVARRSPDLRCAICHDVASGAGACTSCGTLTHADCRAEAGACPTLGCVHHVRIVIVPRAPAATDDVRGLVIELRDWVVNSAFGQICAMFMVLTFLYAGVRIANRRSDHEARGGWTKDTRSIESEITRRIPG